MQSEKIAVCRKRGSFLNLTLNIYPLNRIWSIISACSQNENFSYHGTRVRRSSIWSAGCNLYAHRAQLWKSKCLKHTSILDDEQKAVKYANGKERRRWKVKVMGDGNKMELSVMHVMSKQHYSSTKDNKKKKKQGPRYIRESTTFHTKTSKHTKLTRLL